MQQRSARVVQLRPHTKPAPIDDSIFFHKGQVRVGTRFIYMGRTDPNSVWTVTRIVDHHSRRTKIECNRLSDGVLFSNDETGERREAVFSYMSYSAIWRLKE